MSNKLNKPTKFLSLLPAHQLVLQLLLSGLAAQQLSGSPGFIISNSSLPVHLTVAALQPTC